MCNYALVFLLRHLRHCEPCMSRRLVYLIASVMFICISTRQINGWMDGWKLCACKVFYVICITSFLETYTIA